MAETDTSLTPLLADFGIEYPNAPKASPALLAFMRGLGMNLAQSEDTRKQGLSQIKNRGVEARTAIDRTAARSRESATGDLIRRGVLGSGEANTRFARQDEDTATKRSDLALKETEATTAIENAYESARGAYRQTALERVLGEEQRQSDQAASAKAQEDSFKRQEEASAKAYQQQKSAQDEYLKQMEALYAKYGAGQV